MAKMTNPRTIKVDMEVEHIRPIGEDTVQIDGYVGDYRVILYLPRTDLRLRLQEAHQP